jgi:DNA polymerase-3 subunit gamma/tau
LEEPPEHAKFLLATTDPQKLPATILSRCLQFHLKNLSPDRISAYLAHVLEREMIQAESAGLAELGRAAEGSMRDALSLTDQAIAFGGGQIKAADVSAMLGSIASGNVVPLLKALQQGQARSMLDAVNTFAEHGAEFGKVVDMVLHWLHQVALVQWVPNTLEHAQVDQQTLDTLAREMAPEDVQLFYQMLSTGRSEVISSSDPKAAFEMLLLRLLAFKPALAFSDEPANFAITPAAITHTASEAAAEVTEVAIEVDTESPLPVDSFEQSEGATEACASQEKVTQSRADELPPPWEEQPVGDDSASDSAASSTHHAPLEPSDGLQNATEADHAKKSEPAPPLEAIEEPFNLSVASWPEAFIHLGLSGILYNVISHCECVRVTDTEAEFCLDERNASLFNDSHVAKFEVALAQAEGRPRTVLVKLGNVTQTPAKWLQQRDEQRLQLATQAINNDPVVQALCQTFDAQVVPDSIKARLH